VPVFGMQKRGKCLGVAFNMEDSEIRTLERREGSGYEKKDVKIDVEGVGRVDGVVFVTDNDSEKFIGDLDQGEVALLTLHSGKGRKGTGEEYLENTQNYLEDQLGEGDTLIDDILETTEETEDDSISMQLPVYDNAGNMKPDQIGMPKVVRDELEVSPNDHVIVKAGDNTKILRVRRAPSDLVSGDSQAHTPKFITISRAVRNELGTNTVANRRSTPKFKTIFQSVEIRSAG